MHAMLERLLVEVPERMLTPRLVLRVPRPGDGAAMNAALVESQAELAPWLPWMRSLPEVRESEAVCRRMNGQFRLREDLPLWMLERAQGDQEGAFVGGTGLHRIDWAARCVEVGYWCRTSRIGRGLVGEAVQALTSMAFESLDARRVEIRCDARNARSRGVAERGGFVLEGVLRQQALGVDGAPRDTCVYAKVRA